MEASGAGERRKVEADGNPVDYWFDLGEDTDAGTKTCRTYGYGLLLDERSTTGPDDARSFTDLMAEALPAIQADIDAYGIG